MLFSFAKGVVEEESKLLAEDWLSDALLDELLGEFSSTLDEIELSMVPPLQATMAVTSAKLNKMLMNLLLFFIVDPFSF